MGLVSLITTPRVTTRGEPMKTALLALTLFGPALAQAQGAEIFKGADLALGARLIAENRCAQCHISKVGGDGSSIYRPKGRINNAGLLRGMVENCSAQLNLQLFPEEVTAIAAVLNRDHYKFN
jgi:hypothetical protein